MKVYTTYRQLPNHKVMCHPEDEEIWVGKYICVTDGNIAEDLPILMITSGGYPIVDSSSFEEE